jgi:two-component system, sensor histidine kinase LadS
MLMLSIPFRALEFRRKHPWGFGLLRLVGFLLLMLCASARADHPPVLVLAEEDAKQIQVIAQVLHHKDKALNIEEVKKLEPRAFKRLMEETMFDLKPKEQLWLKVDVQRTPDSSHHWVFWVPVPLIDFVSLFASGSESKPPLRAGDRVPQSKWTEPGRYARFNLEVPDGKSTYYLLIEGSTPISIPLHVGSIQTYTTEESLGMLGLGLMNGLLLTLLLICLATAYTYRDRMYLFYGVYVGVLMLAVSAYTGVAGYLLWSESPRWADAAQGILPIFAAGGAMYFVETLLGGRHFARRLSNALLALGILSFPLAFVYFFLPRSGGVVLLAAYMLCVGCLGLSLAVCAWQRGDRVGQWVFFAYLPLVLAVLMALARAFGWVTVSWWVQYGVVAALIIEVPFMLLALNSRSRDRHEIQTREQALNTQDALTGLLAEHIFDDRLRQTLARYTKRREDAAVVLISLVNYEQIARAYGLPVAEQSVLRAVIKLRKVLRNDVDTIARIGTSQFGLVLEGVGHRSRITDIGARLIAQGLMPLPGLIPEVTLQFHLAAALMRELPKGEADLKGELLALLSTMSSRTRRPIRFLEQLRTDVSPLAPIPQPTPVDDLAKKVQAQSSAEPSTLPQKRNAEDDSDKNWHTSGSSNSSMSGDTLAIER